MDELQISGRKYISSKRASEITGYAKDYVGQLARGEKVPATRVGRAWYVDEEAIKKHAAITPQEEIAPTAVPKSVEYKPVFQPVHLPKTWSAVRYEDDDRALFPVLQANLDALEKGEETSVVTVRKIETPIVKKAEPTVVIAPKVDQAVSIPRRKHNRFVPKTLVFASVFLLAFVVASLFLSSESDFTFKGGDRYVANVSFASEYVNDLIFSVKNLGLTR